MQYNPVNKYVKLLLGFTLAFLCIQGVSAAETYQLVTTWGSSGSGNGQFSEPLDVATDASGNVYVADYLNNRIQKFTSQGAFLGTWGSFGTGPGQFNWSGAVASDALGNLYVCDTNGDRVQKFRADGTFLTQWGSTGTGPGQFRGPEGIAVDRDGNVYVVDLNNNRIQKFTSEGTFLIMWGSEGTGDSQFITPTGVAVDPSGNVYVVEWNGGSGYLVRKFTSSGSFLKKWGSKGTGDGQFMGLTGIATDTAGNVYVSDSGNGRVQKFTAEGVYLGKFGAGVGTGAGQFWGASGLDVDLSGNVFVAESHGNRIQKYAPVTSASNPLSVTAITPPTGTNDRSISATVTGTGFRPGALVKLTLTGQPDIVATGVTLSGDSAITCAFDLTGRAAGTWNLAVTNPADGTTSVRSSAFTLTAPGPTGTTGTITVRSSPTGADIFIDGELQQATTPYTFTGIAPGSHSVTVSKIGYLGRYATVMVPSGGSVTVDEILEPLPTGTGIISVRSTPAGASIVLDGRITGKTTPYDFYEVSPGTHTLSVTMVEYGTYTKTVTVEPGTTVIVTTPWSYSEQDAVVFFNSDPQGATVYIDEMIKGTTPLNLHLKAGTYSVTLRKEGYKDDSSTIVVSSGDVREVNRALQTPGFAAVLALAALAAVILYFRRFR